MGSLALLFRGQHVVGLGGQLEHPARLVARVRVGVKLLGLLEVGHLDLGQLSGLWRV